MMNSLPTSFDLSFLRKFETPLKQIHVTGDEIFGSLELKYQVVGSQKSHCPSSFETNSTDFQTVLYLGNFLHYSARGFAQDLQ